MSRRYRLLHWLLTAGVLGVALSLIASSHHNPGGVPVANAPAAPTAAAKPRTVASLPAHSGVAANDPRHHYIVQSASADAARDAVLRAGGVVTGDLSVIRAVAASLNELEMAALRAAQVAQLHIYNDTAVAASSLGALPETYYPSEVDAANLHVGGMTGRGVTVAVLDSGLWNKEGPLQYAPGGTSRVLAQYDVILARQSPGYYQPSPLETYSRSISDPYGHGTHVSSIIASSGVATTGKYQGVAPGVN